MNWPWKIAVFGAGEKSGNFGSLSNPIEKQIIELNKVATNKYVAALAQIDYEKAPAYRFILDPKNRFKPINLGEINTGDATELIKFMIWADETCKSNKNVLILSGHGLAWQDKIMETHTRGFTDRIERNNFFSSVSKELFGIDKKTAYINNERFLGILSHSLSSKKEFTVGTRAALPDKTGDYLSNQELKQSVFRIENYFQKPIDIIVFDSCLLSSTELMYELLGSTKYAIASVDELSASGMNIAGLAYEITSHKGKLEALECGKLMCDVFEPSFESDSCVCISLIKEDWNKTLMIFNKISVEILNIISTNNSKKTIIKIFEKSSKSLKSYNNINNKRFSGLTDLASLSDGFIYSKSKIITDKLKDYFKLLRNEMDKNLIVGSKLGRHLKESNALGISIFTPINHDQFINNIKDYSKLDFPSESGWINILKKLYD